MGSIRLYGSTSGYLELQAPAVAPDAVLTLPSDSVQPGLVHLHTETFSAVSSVSIDNVFSSTYENYQMLFSFTSDRGAGGVGIFGTLRSSGVDETGANYSRQELNATGTSVSGIRTTGATNFIVGAAGLGTTGTFDQNASVINFYGPALSQPTVVNYSINRSYDAALIQSIAQNHSLSTSYDGLTVSISSGTMTGTLRIYGYRNS